jgi:sec-independent protein translocase protein TatC
MSGKNTKTEMTFLDHLEELRWHILRSAVALVVLTVVAFIFKSIVFDMIILGPSKSDFLTNRTLCWLGKNSFIHSDALCFNSAPIKLQNIQMAGQFTAHIKISLIAGLILAFPYIFYEIWKFIKPALYLKELKKARGAVLFISILFFVGVLFGYFVICPMSINFLINYQVSDLAVNNIQLMSYISLVASICLASGIMFELPAIVLFLTNLGLLTPEFLKKYRRHSIIVILIVAAIITPPDVFSQILVTIPLLALYELSIGLSKRALKKKLNNVQANQEI